MRALILLGLGLALACGPSLAPMFEAALYPVGLCAGCTVPAQCPAGESSFPSEPDCASVGNSCGALFEKDPSGWGCRAVLPSSPCTGATREAPGSTTCVPIGDCAAPFPPPGATLFVDDSFAQTDSTHFRSIEAAVVAAGPNAVIAIDEGTYAEAIIDPLDPMTLHGRCAEKVRVVGTGGNQVALYAFQTRGIVVRGVTLIDHAGGVFADQGGLTLEDSVVESHDALGVFSKNGSTLTVRRSRISSIRQTPGTELGAAALANTGSSLVLEDVALTGNEHRGAAIGGPGSSLSCTRCVVARTRRKAGFSAADLPGAMLAYDRSSLTVLDSAVLDNDGDSLYADGANVTVTGSVLQGSHGRLSTSDGLGVFAGKASTVRLEQVTLAEDPVIGLYTDDPGTVVTLAHVTVRGPATLTGVEIGRGAQVTNGSSLVATDVAVARVSSAGIAFQSSGNGTLDHVAVRDVREIAWPVATMPYGGFGVLCEEMSICSAKKLSVERATLSSLSATLGSTFTAEDVVVRDAQQSSASGAGNAGQIARSGRLTVARGFFLGSLGTGFVVTKQGVLDLTDSVVSGSLKDPAGGFGHGITVFDQGVVLLTRTALSHNAGIGFVADDAQAQLTAGSIDNNTVGLHVQNGSFLSVSDGNEALMLHEVRVSNATEFKDNQTRLGTGVVPLPKP